jgi:hypothetical protein
MRQIENCTLLGDYAALVVILYRRFGTDRLSQNVGKELSLTLRNSPAKCSSHLLRGGNLQSGMRQTV